MIISYLSLLSSLLLLFFIIIIIHGHEEYHIGIVNHNTKWYIHCPQNNTRIINPPIDDQPLVPYQCPYSSLPIDILPVDIDFTFICRLQSRLIWIMVDLYHYNTWLWSINIQQLNISMKFNKKLEIKDYKSEITNHTNRFIIINAFYIPFESLEFLSNEIVEISIEINQCLFYINEKLIWNDIIHNNCSSIQTKNLYVQSSYCNFYPKLIPIESSHQVQIEIFDSNTTEIPDYNLILSIDEHKIIESTTHFYDHRLLIEEHYRKFLSAFTIITKHSTLLTYIFIFTVIILIALALFFIYLLCYHYHNRTIRKSILSI